MGIGKIGLVEGMAAMGALMDWGETARDPDSEGGIGITVNEALDLAKAQISALGLNVTIIGGEDTETPGEGG